MASCWHERAAGQVGENISTARPRRFANTLSSFGVYQQERADFLVQARRSGAQILRYPHPRFANLSVDVAVLPGEIRSAALVVVSGTHGIEGHAGSAIQRQLLRDAPEHRMVDLIVIHGLNPHGFAHDRRVDENNVDVNRNFVDFEKPPANADYARLHDLLVPEDWEGPAHEQAQRSLLELAQKHGLTALQSAVTRGQYTHPDGLFFGGDRPSWSNETLREVVVTLVRGHQSVGYIDLHTGLGQAGVGEPIFRGGDDPDAYDRACRWYGDQLTRSEDGTASSTPIGGNTAKALSESLRGTASLTAITLEFGTLDGRAVLGALQGDNWFGRAGKRSCAEYEPVRQAMRAAFAPRDLSWQHQVLTRGAEVIGMAERGLLADAAAQPMNSLQSRHKPSGRK